MIEKTIDLLGLKATDKVTGFAGVISSACFDLYGCVQLAITPPADDKGGLPDGRWFDVHRVSIDDADRVMPVPDFAKSAPTPKEFKHGPAEKPAPK